MADEHPWVTKARQKLYERGYRGDRLNEELERMLIRFPFLRPQETNPHAGLHRAISIANKRR